MKKRAYHSKSRRGCSNCKTKHIKCDEQGPPCANCISREREASCAYNSTVDASAKTSIGRVRKSPPGQSTEHEFQRLQARHLLELELMHRWTSTTYRCVLQMEGDAHYHRIEIPRAALSEHYLLNSIYSLTALDIAVRGWDGDRWEDIPSLHHSSDPGDRKLYIQAALEYYDKAIVLFRSEIDKLSPRTYHCAYIFACHVFIINMALPQAVPAEHEPVTQEDMAQKTPNIFTRLATTFSLMQGAGRIVRMDPEWWKDTPVEPIILAGFSALKSVSQTGLKPPRKAIWQSVKAVADAEVPDWMDSTVYRGSMDQLATLLLIEDGAVVIHGWTLALPMFMGQGFLDAFLAQDRLALFVILHWAVHLVADEHWFWWLKHVGRETVGELCQILRTMDEPVGAGKAWRDGLDWAEESIRKDPKEKNDLDL